MTTGRTWSQASINNTYYYKFEWTNIGNVFCILLIFRNFFIENKRKIDGYVEEKLKQALNTQLEELEEKSKIAEQARAYFGEDMYKKLMEIDGSRSEALMFDQGYKRLFPFLF